MKLHAIDQCSIETARRSRLTAATAVALYAFCTFGLYAADTRAATESVAMNKAMEANEKQMQNMKMTGDADRDFAMMMKIHHEGAVKMARIELQHGKDPKMRAMAKDIIAAQKKEITEFNQWLSQK